MSSGMVLYTNTVTLIYIYIADSLPRQLYTNRFSMIINFYSAKYLNIWRHHMYSSNVNLRGRRYWKSMGIL